MRDRERRRERRRERIRERQREIEREAEREAERDIEREREQLTWEKPASANMKCRRFRLLLPALMPQFLVTVDLSGSWCSVQDGYSRSSVTTLIWSMR